LTATTLPWQRIVVRHTVVHVHVYVGAGPRGVPTYTYTSSTVTQAAQQSHS